MSRKDVPQPDLRMTSGFDEHGKLSRRGFLTVSGVGAVGAAAAYFGREHLGDAGKGAAKAAGDALKEAGRFLYSEEDRKKMERIIGGKMEARDERIVAERKYVVRARRQQLHKILGRQLPEVITSSDQDLIVQFSALAGIPAGMSGVHELSEDGMTVTSTLPYPRIVEPPAPDLTVKPKFTIEKGLIDQIWAQVKRNGGQDSIDPDDVLDIAFRLMQVGQNGIIAAFLQKDTSFQDFAKTTLQVNTGNDLLAIRDAFKLPYQSRVVNFGEVPQVKKPIPEGVFIDPVGEPIERKEDPLPLPSTTIPFASSNSPDH